MGAFIDLTGQTFGWLDVSHRDGLIRNQPAWVCRCKCGAIVRVPSQALREGVTRSCGCFRFARSEWDGGSKRYRKRNYVQMYRRRRELRVSRPERELLVNAKDRALRNGWSCTITLADISVPDRCPVLGIPLRIGEGKRGPGSPTLDRIDNSRGYDPGNVAVISWRANNIKSDATLEELESLVSWLQARLRLRCSA